MYFVCFVVKHMAGNVEKTVKINNKRGLHARASAIWTGTDLLIWGGDAGATSTNDGFRFVP